MTHSEFIAPRTVLIVDDEPVNIKLLGSHLKKAGFNVIEAADGHTAISKAALGPDLILLDIMMPGMDGLETCQQLKENHNTQDIPVIFLSALSDTEVKTRGLQVGGVDYISKPFDSRELLARVRTHLTIKDQEQQIRLYADHLEEMVEERTRQLREAQLEIKRDYEIQTVIATLLRFSLDTTDLNELLQLTLERILTVTSSSFQSKGCIFLMHEESGIMRMAGGANLDTAIYEQCQEVEKGRCICGSVAESGEPLVAWDDDPLHGPPLQGVEAHGHFCMPIKYGERLLGVINIYLIKGHEPDAKERDFLGAVANTLARIILYKQAQQKLVESEEQYRAIFENTGTAMAILRSDTSIVLVNSGFEALTGLDKEQLEGKRKGLDFFHPEDRDEVRLCHEQMYAIPEADQGIRELRFVNHKGQLRHVSLIESLIPGTNQNVASLLDITDRKRAEELVLHHAYHDSLTDLPNRSYLLDRLADCVERVNKEQGYEFAVLYMDLDRFNLVNESLGHDIGDKLIVELAKRLKTLLREQDIIVRIGGDEFVIVLNGYDDFREVTDLAVRMLSLVRQPFVLNDQELASTSSIGIALSSLGYSRGEDLLRDADTALHRAKQRGKARYEVFDTEMHHKATNLLALVTDMRQALRREEFLLHYQPFVDLRTGGVYGFEALVRWKHPTRGMVSPGEFIPEAEESGLIIPIGQWVLHEACATMGKLFRKSNSWRMLSVNLSGKQFAHEDIYEHVRAVLDATGFDPRCLKLEITESAVMEDAAAAIEMLQRLKTLDVKISIDDFGTGYSSLSYLHRFPVDSLKIDRSFVSSMGQAGENTEIVRTIVDLAHSLELQVIAEGVETEDQLRMLKTMGCEYAQGYFFSRPVDHGMLVERDLIARKW